VFGSVVSFRFWIPFQEKKQKTVCLAELRQQEKLAAVLFVFDTDGCV